MIRNILLGVYQHLFRRRIYTYKDKQQRVHQSFIEFIVYI